MHLARGSISGKAHDAERCLMLKLNWVTQSAFIPHSCCISATVTRSHYLQQISLHTFESFVTMKAPACDDHLTPPLKCFIHDHVE